MVFYDVWMSRNVPSYGGVRPIKSPTIALSKANHDATKAIYRNWLKEVTGKQVGGKVNWANVSNREMFNLSERMFDSANVPVNARNEYYRALNRYLYTGAF